MSRSLALALLVAAAATPIAAQPTALQAPPPWQDRASVYLNMDDSPHSTSKQPEPPGSQAAATTAPVATTASKLDSDVVPVAHAAADVQSDDTVPRRLAPPSNDSFPNARVTPTNVEGSTAARRISSFGLPHGSVYTVASALVMAIGAFLLCVWLVRRGNRKPVTMLPAEVVSVIGRVPLAARQYAELLRVGNKLILVAFTPTGPKTLTEVTDAVEVDRLVGLCQQYDPHSTTKAFEQVFRQLSRETAPTGLSDNEPTLAAFPPRMEAYGARQGGNVRA